MNKNRIRLTESQLHKVIKESVKNVLKEGDEDMGTIRPWNGVSHPNAITFDEEGYGYNSKGELVYHPNIPTEYYPNRLDDVPFDVMSESKLHRVIKESVMKILNEDYDYDVVVYDRNDAGIRNVRRVVYNGSKEDCESWVRSYCQQYPWNRGLHEIEPSQESSTEDAFDEYGNNISDFPYMDDVNYD